jgi:hypothetical protein
MLRMLQIAQRGPQVLRDNARGPAAEATLNCR